MLHIQPYFSLLMWFGCIPEEGGQERVWGTMLATINHCRTFMNWTIFKWKWRYLHANTNPSHALVLFACLWSSLVSWWSMGHGALLPMRQLGLSGGSSLPHSYIHFLSPISRRALLLPFGRGPHLLVTSAINIYIQGRKSIYGVPAQGHGCVMTSSRFEWLVETLR